MARDQLFKELCKTETMRTGWYLAQADSRDDFVSDPVGNADFASNLDEILNHLIGQVQTDRFRPRSLLEIDIPKSGLSVRPGNVLPIEEASLLHSIVLLLAPLLDKQLSESVFSFRLHPDIKKRIKKRASLFRHTSIVLPFLKRSTIRTFSPFESWYELWPEFEARVLQSYTSEGFTHLTKTDISAYFENIDLRLLETQVTNLLRPNENRILQVMFRVLHGWTRITSMGAPIERGIPQGNEISSFLGNLYLLPLDNVLIRFCKKYDAKWFRYMDDVKVFTKCERDAKEVVFIINKQLRSLHLNLQGSKTEIISGHDLQKELHSPEQEQVDNIYDIVLKLDPTNSSEKTIITSHLKSLSKVIPKFRRDLPNSVKSLNTRDNRLFRRLLTLYGYCRRTHFTRSAFEALRHLPDSRILKKTLVYLSQMPMSSHHAIVERLLGLLESDELPFPYQAAMVLDAIAKMHPKHSSKFASRIRLYGLKNKSEWIVVQKAIEAISVYPYRSTYATNLAIKFLKHEHPLVRRAACVLLVRGSKEELSSQLEKMIYHADPGVNRLALYFLRFINDVEFATKEIERLKKSKLSNFVFQRSLPQLYALSASCDKKIAQKVHNFIDSYPQTKSVKHNWHRSLLLSRTDWSLP